MSVILALLGLVGMTVFFIKGIIELFRRKSPKKSLILCGASFVVAVVGVMFTPPSDDPIEDINTYVDSSDNNSSNDDETADTDNEVKNSEENKETNSPTNKNEENKEDKENKDTNESTVVEAAKEEVKDESKTETKPVNTTKEDVNNKTEKTEESKKDNTEKEKETNAVSTETTAAPKDYTLKHGELVSVNEMEKTLIIKAKIKSSMSNKLTVSQNFYNVADVIIEQGGDTFDEIQYWAVADMSNGSEQKVISFTVDKDLIKSITENDVYPNELKGHVSDLWIHASLK